MTARGLCECGCGEPTNLAPGTDRRKGWIAGEPVRFVWQHHKRKAPAEYVADDGGCWVWQRSVAPNGYGLAWRDGRKISAHVLVYEREVGPVPDGLELDHLCRNRACVNPAHLEPVTHRENSRRGFAAAPRARGADGRFTKRQGEP